MIQIHFDEPDFRIRMQDASRELFDSFRKKWVKLTPEEWVRQNLLRYLKERMHYPASMIAVERLVAVGELKRRFDAVIFDGTGRPWMLVECKAETELLDDKVFQQILAYQSKLGARYMLISNGLQTHCWGVAAHGLQETNQLPVYPTQNGKKPDMK